MGHGPQMEPSWDSGAAAGGGASQDPLSPGVRLKARTLDICRREGAGQLGTSSGCPTLQAMGPGWAGGDASSGPEGVWMCEWSVPPLLPSGPVSQSCSLSSVSLSHLFCLSLSVFVLMSPSLSLLSFLLSHSFLSLYFSSPSLPLSLDLLCLCPPFVLMPAAAAGFPGPHLPGLSHVTQSPLSASPAQLSFWLRGQMVESQAPTFPVLRGLASWSGSATGSCLGVWEERWSAAI